MAAGIGKNLSRARLMLAQRAGYLPRGIQLNPRNAVAQWRASSKNLARDARAQGYGNPVQMLRDMATGVLPRSGDPQAGALAYMNSRLAAVSPEPEAGLPVTLRNRFRIGAPIAPELGDETQPHFRPEVPAPPLGGMLEGLMPGLPQQGQVPVFPMPRPVVGGPDYRGAARRFAAARRRPVRRPISGAEY